MQQSNPDDFVISTGETRTVREFCGLAFKYAGIDTEWKGECVNERGINKATGEIVVEVNPEFFRPTEVDLLLGGPTKAKNILGWNPRKTPFEQLVKIMVENDIKRVKQND